MSIEKDIQQKAFKTIRQKAMLNIMFTYGWLLERIKMFLATEDITHQQYNLLRILRGSYPKPLSTLQIRDRMLDKMSDTSRIVDRLVAKELVSKTPCSADKRLVDVTITEKGQNLLTKLDHSSAYIESFLKGISEKEAEQISFLLDKLRNSEESDQ